MADKLMLDARHGDSFNGSCAINCAQRRDLLRVARGTNCDRTMAPALQRYSIHIIHAAIDLGCQKVSHNLSAKL